MGSELSDTRIQTENYGAGKLFFSPRRTLLDLRIGQKRRMSFVYLALILSASTFFALAVFLEMEVFLYAAVADIIVLTFLAAMSRKQLYTFSDKDFVMGNKRGSLDQLWFEAGEPGAVMACFSDGTPPVIVADSLTVQQAHDVVTRLNRQITEFRGEEPSEASVIW